MFHWEELAVIKNPANLYMKAETPRERNIQNRLHLSLTMGISETPAVFQTNIFKRAETTPNATGNGWHAGSMLAAC